MPTSTPWGPAQHSTKLATGIMSYSTSSHGGIHLSPKKNALVPDYMRNEDGWYEEDCAWAIPAVIFANEFIKAYGTDIASAAIKTLRHWYPDAFEKFTGIELREGDSFKRDKEIFAKRHANDYVAVSACTVLDDMVRVTATLGGVRDFSVAKDFLVPATEYSNRGKHGFIINPEVHKEVSLF